MPYTDADLADIRAKITQAKRVSFADGRSVENHALDQLLAAEAVIVADLKLQATNGGNVARRRRTPYYRSGL